MAQNKVKVVLNALEGSLQLLSDLELGWSVKNLAKAPFFIAAGYTRVYPNLEIPVGMEIEVQDDGELIVF